MRMLRPVVAWIASGLIRRHALAVAGSLVVLTTTACVSIGRDRVETSSLESTFPEMGRLKVTAYRDQDWCKVLAYARGSFSDSPSHSTCDLFDGPPSTFDTQAQADFDDLRKSLNGSGISPVYVLLEYRDRAVKTAVFEVGCGGCESGRYIYESGGGPTQSELGPGSSQMVLSPHWTWYEER